MIMYLFTNVSGFDPRTSKKESTTNIFRNPSEKPLYRTHLGDCFSKASSKAVLQLKLTERMTCMLIIKSLVLPPVDQVESRVTFYWSNGVDG